MKPPYIQKNYYAHALLCNGTDFCQLDFSGSMAFKAQIKGLGSYWYRKGRPNLSDPLGIVKLQWIYGSDFGPVQLSEFDQTFDTPTAVLKTRVSGYQFEIDVEAFLTDEHTLVETFTMLKSEAAVGRIVFPMMFGEYSETNKTTKAFFDHADGNLNIRGKSGDATLGFDYSWKDEKQEFQGAGKSSLRMIKGSGTIECSDGDGKYQNYFVGLSAEGIKTGDVIMRVTTLMDSIDSSDWKACLEYTHADALKSSPDDLKQKHIESWRKRTGASSLSCDDVDIQRAFDVSKYVCSASLAPNGSTVSALAVPNDHGMGTYWDAWYVHQGLLTANCVDDANKMIEFWKLAASNGRKAAAAMGAEGIRFPWVIDFEGKATFSDAPQIHNNIIPVVNIWNQYEYTLDENILSDNFELMRETLRFISSFALRKDDNGKPYLRELIPVDENPKHKKNELTTTVIFLKGAEVFLKAAEILGKVPDPQIVEEQAAFQSILDDLSEGDTWRIYEGGNAGGWATFLAHIHLPRPGKVDQSFSAALDFCSESHGLGPGKTSRMRCATWPWLDGVAAWSMAKNMDKRALYWIEHMLGVSNIHGGIPEYVWTHGEPSREWFLGAHGVFLAALAEILVQRNGDRLCFFPLGTDKPWIKTVNVKQLRIAGALLISLELENDGTCKVILENTSNKTQSMSLFVGETQVDEINILAGAKKDFVVNTE